MTASEKLAVGVRKKRKMLFCFRENVALERVRRLGDRPSYGSRLVAYADRCTSQAYSAPLSEAEINTKLWLDA